jgi:hypothetical protein
MNAYPPSARRVRGPCASLPRGCADRPVRSIRTSPVRRLLTCSLAAGLLGLVATATIDALRGSAASPRHEIDVPTVVPSPTQAAGLKDELGDACSDALECWTREVALGASYRIVGNTGTAWVLRARKKHVRGDFYFWATHGRARDLGPPVGLLGDVAVFGDGVRFAWRVRRVTAWVEPADERRLKLRTLNPLVATSSTFPVRGSD